MDFFIRASEPDDTYGKGGRRTTDKDNAGIVRTITKCDPKNVLRQAVQSENQNGAMVTTITSWNAQHPRQPVAIAAVHEPYAVPPLLGQVPVVLAGHFHQRSVRLDASGTRIMIEGSTGGAGLTSDTMHRVAEGQPVPLDATLLYVARKGERAGQVVAYDGVWVAVDSNVLIYERIREEVRAGRTAISAIDAGFTRALATILDSNITTFIAAAVLFYIGTGPVRGFAVTLGIGILTSLFTAFTLTRLIVAYWVRLWRPRTVPI